ncbi:hypothetical protein [Microcella sp.]|nr:hypothetical protein [Microcella sp.]
MALYDGTVHCFVERGEIELSTELQNAIRRRYFKPANKNQEFVND